MNTTSIIAWSSVILVLSIICILIVLIVTYLIKNINKKRDNEVASLKWIWIMYGITLFFNLLALIFSASAFGNNGSAALVSLSTFWLIIGIWLLYALRNCYIEFTKTKEININFNWTWFALLSY